MKLVLSAVFSLLTATGSALAEENETPATPRFRTVPDYPASCRSAKGSAPEPHQVIVGFDVTKDGQTANVQAVESTDRCFEEAAVAAVRSWIYEPRRVNGRAQPQEGLKATISFVWSDEAAPEEEIDEAPIKRIPPYYPEKCIARANKSESVTLVFDLTKGGRTENIRVVNSTNKCLNKAAIKAVSRWRYRERIVDGEPVARKDIETVVTFQLSDGVPPDLVIRWPVKKKLNSAKRALTSENDPDKALIILQQLENEYGDSFSRIELASFHQVRATARLEAGDYRGALDDFRMVKKMGMADGAAEAIDEVIEDLEAALAAQEAAAAVSQEKTLDSEEETDPR